MNKNKLIFEINEEKTLYQGFCRLVKYKLRHTLFSGGWSSWLNREILIRPEVVGVLPFDPERKVVVMIKQFRAGTILSQQSALEIELMQNDSSWLLEIVAGIQDKNGESLEQLAIRELREETGLVAKEIKPIYSYWNSPGSTTERVNFFCAHVDSTKISTITGCREEGEDILVKAYTLSEIKQKLANKQIDNSLSLIALQWLLLNYE